MKRDEYYQKIHDKEIKSLAEAVKRIVSGLFWVTSVKMDKSSSDEDSYRLVVFMREKK